VLCKRCQGSLQPIQKQGQEVFWLCRPCKMPHDKSGRPMISSPKLQSDFNPLQKARDTIKAVHPTMAPVGRTALEVAFITALQECYFNGLRDGVLLAYSQDHEASSPYDGHVQSPPNNTGEGA
jgi:hypothetical protein